MRELSFVWGRKAWGPSEHGGVFICIQRTGRDLIGESERISHVKNRSFIMQPIQLNQQHAWVPRLGWNEDSINLTEFSCFTPKPRKKRIRRKSSFIQFLFYCQKIDEKKQSKDILLSRVFSHGLPVLLSVTNIVPMSGLQKWRVFRAVPQPKCLSSHILRSPLE